METDKTDTLPLSKRCEDMDNPIKTELSEILKNCKSIKGPTTRFILNITQISEGEFLRKKRLGEKNDDKPHKVILMVGETGTGKTALINAMINYIMGVRWEHKIWLQIPEHQTESLTAAVTVYEVFVQDSPFSLIVIDTPGFGSTQGRDKDKLIPEALQQLFRSEDGIHEIHAVCLVLKGSDARLHERQRYIMDEIFSLFGKDLENNLVVLITNSHETVPKKSLNFIKAARIPCAKKKGGQPVYFKFDNCQSECIDEEERESYKASWDSGIENFEQFFDYLNRINAKSTNMTESVLSARKQLNAKISNLKDRIKQAKQRKQEQQQSEETLEDLKEYRRTMNNFEYEVDEFTQEKVSIESKWWHLTTQATCCTDCKENCHYPGCWWAINLSWCSVMTKSGTCSVCTGKCHYTKHVKDDTIFKVVHHKVKRTEEDMKNNYEKKFGENKCLLTRLKDEIQQIEAEKIRLVEECYQCLEKLTEVALKSTSMSTFQHLDFMIEKVKETGKQERVKKLENLKRRAQEENKGEYRVIV
uniref:AAA+ ATPase domain-containing protein n=1 Tax=Cyprinus carpio TaxID=7962 RepID=A0A8C1SJD8_CYPCA